MGYSRDILGYYGVEIGSWIGLDGDIVGVGVPGNVE